MLKVVHIHTDPKFVHGGADFCPDAFDNHTIVIGQNPDQAIHFDEKTFFVPSRRSGLNKAVALCGNADLVVLWDLDTTKSYIVRNLPPKTRVAWRFFGHELYRRNIEAYLSDVSLTFYKRMAFGTKKSVQTALGAVKCWLKYGLSSERMFRDAVRRTDLFLCLSEYEYEEIKNHCKKLPVFIQLPLLQKRKIGAAAPRNDIILIGNNRSIFNNHLDVLRIVERRARDRGLSFLLPFSYGPENAYTQEVRRVAAAASADIRTIEGFLPESTYFDLIAGAKAAVFNSYRQMAMGNILLLLQKGCKIYMNPRNAIYRWFLDFGLRVSSVKDFASDLDTGCLEITPEEHQANLLGLERIRETYSCERFVEDLGAASAGNALDRGANSR